jgi:putative redox protein
MGSNSISSELEWNGGLQFQARTGGFLTEMDGDRRAAATPMDLLMQSLAGCMSVDIVNILQRMRLNLRTVKARIEGSRADSPPKRFVALHLHFDVSGENIKPEAVERAVQLSRQTYCSVYASLRPDIDFRVTWDVTE